MSNEASSESVPATLFLTCKNALDVQIAEHTCSPCPVPNTPRWGACHRAFEDEVEEALGADSDPNDKITLIARDENEEVLFEHECRPAPAPNTQAWEDCFTEFVDGLAGVIEGRKLGG